MIIDSHAHYSHPRFSGEFSYIGREDGAYTLERGTLPELICAMRERGIGLCIEAGIDLHSVAPQLALQEAFGGFFRQALGVHPKRCGDTAWEDRLQLDRLAEEHPFIAIGETGLDYAMPPEQLHKEEQKRWFCYQIALAHRLELPLILHVRQAHADALDILRQHGNQLHGGVAHCFSGDVETAREYLALGFTLGIGGRLLQKDDAAAQLRETVARLPLEALLAETDAPYILPELQEMACSGKQRKRARNTSLILPEVIGEIARLQGLPVSTVEKTLEENTRRSFRL